MLGPPYHVLFLCTANSARSIIAEAVLAQRGGARFGAFSAGSQPRGAIHPLALQALTERGYETDGLRSKSWDEFSNPDAPPIHFVFTLCDRAAQEPCPSWPAKPVTAHWGIEDPAAFQGTEDEQRWRFRRVCQQLERRIDIFTNLRIESLDELSLQAQLSEIGKAPD